MTPTNKLPILGGFVCDEMGLGKTIMMIATIVANFIPRTLIVLPNALLEQWKSEILRTTGHVAIVFHGTSKNTITLDTLNHSIIVLTTYGTVTTECILHNIKWSRVIFDEAHHLRNGPKTKRYKSSFALDAKIRWLMTGTPIQNKYSDFVMLCKLLRMPKWMYEKNEQYIIQNYMLKRTKKDVGLLLKDVEKKDINIQWNNSVERTISKNLHENLSERRTDNMLRTILLSRQMCILPTMLQHKLPAMIRDGEIEPTSVGDKIGTSKMDILVDTIIRQIHDEKYNDNTTGKLIFCHFRSEMDELMKRLVLRGVEHKQICIFDGRVKNRERHKILNDKYEILILQIQTCCEGLNLQENYSQIYFVSPNWNPSVEEQAIARCHRYGQNKSVQVFRFYMNKSIDQYILFIQNSKRQIIHDAFQQQQQQPKTNNMNDMNDID